jgi:DNA-directed RNA polymerases I, II, and III subunit RPABC1
MTIDDETLRTYHTSYMVMLGVLVYRGYTIEDEMYTSIEEFSETYANTSIEFMKDDMSYYEFTDDALPTVTIVWSLEPKLGVKVRDIYDVLEENKINHAIIVSDESVTSGCNEAIRHIRATKNMIIDVWTLKASMIPVYKIAPKHEILSTQEKAAVLKSYGLSSKTTKLPKILTSDGMVKVLGASKGQLIKITRPSDTNPDALTITYRIVR